MTLLDCSVGEDSWCSLFCKEFKPVNPKGNQSKILIGRTEAEAPILWAPVMKNWLIGKDPDAGKDLKARGEGDGRGRDCWIASLPWWTLVWASSGSWWKTGKSGVLQSMGSQRVRHNWATEQQQIYTYIWGSPGGSVVKNPPAHAGDTGLIPGLGRSPGKGLP